MKVEIHTKFESSRTPPKPAVYIQANEVMCTVEVVGEHIRALQIARLWLKKELAK